MKSEKLYFLAELDFFLSIWFFWVHMEKISKRTVYLSKKIRIKKKSDFNFIYISKIRII